MELLGGPLNQPFLASTTQTYTVCSLLPLFFPPLSTSPSPSNLPAARQDGLSWQGWASKIGHDYLGWVGLATVLAAESWCWVFLPSSNLPMILVTEPNMLSWAYLVNAYEGKALCLPGW